MHLVYLDWKEAFCWPFDLVQPNHHASLDYPNEIGHTWSRDHPRSARRLARAAPRSRHEGNKALKRETGGWAHECSCDRVSKSPSGKRKNRMTMLKAAATVLGIGLLSGTMLPN